MRSAILLAVLLLAAVLVVAVLQAAKLDLIDEGEDHAASILITSVL